MADHKLSLPSLTNIIGVVRPNPETRKRSRADEAAPRHNIDSAENIYRENKSGGKDALMACAAHRHCHGDAEECAGLTCSISFTGFRDDDVWRASDYDGGNVHGHPVAHTAGADATPDLSSIFFYKKLASGVPGVRVESTLTESTTVLVARRGFTKKRLLAARQGIPVVLPNWVEVGCPRVEALGGVSGIHTADSVTPYSKYAVPWLHGYVFSTTALSTSERTTIESICTAHGAVVESSLTYRCDVLLTRAECVQELQGLLHTNQTNYAERRRRNQHLSHAKAQQTDAELTKRSALRTTTSSACSKAPCTAWLTDKLRFALELDVPVVDYTKLFAMLRLDRLPPPTWMPRTEALPQTSSWRAYQLGDKDEVEKTRKYTDALSGVGFEELIDVCRVGTPAGGSAEWTRILAALIDGGDVLRTDDDLQRNVGAAEKGGVDSGLISSFPDGAHQMQSSFVQSSSSSCMDDTSTVSDPDAWEDFVSCALVSTLEEGWRSEHAGAAVDVTDTAYSTRAARQSIANTPAATTLLPASQVPLDKLTLNTADVEDLGNTGAAGPSTLHVFSPDYFSATTGTGVTSHIAPQGDHSGPEVLATIGGDSADIAVIEESPRLTTTALLHRGATTPHPPDRTTDVPSPSLCNDTVASGLRHPIADYYAMHQSSLRMPPQLSTRGAMSTSREAGPTHLFGEFAAPTVAEQQQRRLGGGELLAASQVLVESCAEADELHPKFVQHTDPSKATAPRVATVRPSVPLVAMCPPYLTICVLGCTESELRKTARFSEQCRLLRSPVLTPTTDLVVLGSRVLTGKRYTVRSPTDAEVARGGIGENAKQRPAGVRRALPARIRSERGHNGVAITLRYWEMDAVVAWTLADTYGIPLSRIVPLKWLEDAAKEARKACEATKQQKESTTTHKGAADRPPLDGEDSSVDTRWSAATSPPENLTELLAERLADANEASSAPPLFCPLPPVPVDRLPSTASPSYYIRLRRAWSAQWTNSTAHVSAEKFNNMEQEGALARSDAQRQTKIRQTHHVAHQVLSDGSNHPAPGSPPLLTKDAVGKMQTDNEPEEKDCRKAAMTFSTVSVPSDLSPSATTATAESFSGHRRRLLATTPNETNADHSFAAALAAAERRFNHLVALLRVPEDGDGDQARESCDVGEDSRQKRSTILAACDFCCTEDDYARVDWAVVRGLIRYGGGRVDKRPADDWKVALRQRPLVASTPTSNIVHPDAQARDSAPTVCRIAEYTKIRQKLMRALRSLEGAYETSDQADSRVNSECTGATHGGPGTTENMAEIARLTAKLQRVSILCQQAPALCLLPHSFQRATVAEDGTASASNTTHGNKKCRAREETASPHNHLHVLHRIPAVTMDYILSCLAAGYCLHPNSCFLFHTSIPSAPDIRLFNHQVKSRGRGIKGCAASQEVTAQDTDCAPGPGFARGAAPKGKSIGAVGVANGRTEQITPARCRPALSSWVLERRYSKTDSVGVCISPLWKLPTPSVRQGERCWSRVSTASPAAKTAATAVEHCLMPDPSLVPLLRVLLLGFRNAAEALGGHVAETFSASAVTHVLVVDVAGIVSGTLSDAFSIGVGDKDTVVVSGGVSGEPLAYWPMEDIESIVRCAANDTVSLVGIEWLAACVEWGAFVEESVYTPPSDLLQLVQAERQRVALVSAQDAQTKRRQRAAHAQRKLPPQQTAEHCRLNRHRGHIAGTPPADLPPSSAVMRQSTRLASRIERHPKRMSTPPRGVSKVVAPHTPSPSPPRPIDCVSLPNKHKSESREHDECRTPVGRHVPVASHEWNGCALDACTPPLREGQSSVNVAQHRPQSSPPKLLSSPVPPPPGSRTPCRPGSGSQSMDLCARSAGTPSVGGHGSQHHHRRRHSSLSASQHNTRSQLEQQDADAYVEHLSHLFNFFSPGSTPLPSSARRKRERSTAAFVEWNAEHPSMLQTLLQPHSRSPSGPPEEVVPLASASSPPCEVTGEGGKFREPSSTGHAVVIAVSPSGTSPQMSAAKSVDAAVGDSDVLLPSRCRALHGTSAVVKAHTSEDERSAPASPDLQRRRAEEGSVAVNWATVGSQAEKVHAALLDVQTTSIEADAAPPQRLTLPNLIGGSTELSRDGNPAEEAAGVEKGPCALGRQRHSSDYAERVWVCQTPGDLDEGEEVEKSSGAASRPSPQAQVTACICEAEEEGGHTASAEFSWMHDIIPDSQDRQHHVAAVVELADVEPVPRDVLVPASCIEATPFVYESTPGVVAETTAFVHHSNVISSPIPANDREGTQRKKGEKALSPAPHALDSGRCSPPPSRPLTGAVTATPLVQEALQARQTSCNAPQLSFPYSCISPLSIRMAVDADAVANCVVDFSRDEHRCGTPSAHINGLQRAHSPWSRHMPLHLSRRPSRSPTPAPSSLHTGTSVPPTGSTAISAPQPTRKVWPSDELRIYVLHDVPHRDARIRRCEESLKVLMQRRGSVDVVSRSSTLPPTSQLALPLCFVGRCEEADVVVTHEINLRESVLVAVVAGCWVARPGFLECAAAVLDGACQVDSHSSPSLHDGRWSTMPPWPPEQQQIRATDAAPETALVLCVRRLREALPTYEWTEEMLPCAPASGDSLQSGSVWPMQRSLVQQSRRQRQCRGRATSRSAVSGDVRTTAAAPRPLSGRLFEGHGFILFFCTLTAQADPAEAPRPLETSAVDAGDPRTVSRVCATERIIEVGGGHLCGSVQIGCAVVEPGEKTEGGTDVLASSAAVTPPEHPRLRCCAHLFSSQSPKPRALRGSLTSTSFSLVMDADLYHDLLWLVCLSVCRGASEALTVLLDSSLLGTRVSSGDNTCTTVYVSSVLHLPVCGDALPSSGHCSVAAWLFSWLHESADGEDVLTEVDGASRLQQRYTPAAARALRLHLRACCAAAMMIVDRRHTLKNADASYAFADLPFEVTPIEEVRQVCTNLAGCRKTPLCISVDREAIHRIEFRGASWVGACVAAGGTAVMASPTDAWMRECGAQTLYGTLFLE